MVYCFSVVLLSCSFTLAAALTLQATPPPAWANLPVESYPPDARAQISAARQAALEEPLSAAALGQLGLVLQAWGQFEAAATAYAEARRLAPREVDWWVLGGAVALRQRRPDEAAGYFASAASLQPSLLIGLRRADALLEAGRYDEARPVYQALAGTPITEPAARYGLGRIAAATGDASTARQQFERAVALAPTFGAAHYALAQLQRKAGDTAAARASLDAQQRCPTCWPMPPDPWAARVTAVRSDAAAILQRAVAMDGTADDARVIEAHEAALARDPSLVQARTNLIVLYARTGNLAASERHYQAVLASKQNEAEAHHNFGLALMRANDRVRAETVLRLAIERNGADSEALDALGLIFESSGRLDEAETMYRRAVEASPNRRALRFNRIRVLVAQKRYDEALADVPGLIEPPDAESVRYLYAVSAIHVRRGSIAEGRALAETALARARRYGLTDLAAAIERDLATLK